MTEPKKKPGKPDVVSVRLTCILSGAEGDPGPGDVIEVDAEEGKRLINIGAAVAAE